MSPELSNRYLEHAPFPMAMVEGPVHLVRYVNPAFCRLIEKAGEDLIGQPFGEIFPEKGGCLARLDNIFRTGKAESYTEQEYSDPRPVFRTYSMWPVMADGHPAGVMIEVIESAPLYEKALAMNEALILGSLRQHELTSVANTSNTQLQTEVDERKQRELDAHMLTNEISHRIKNNLHIVVGLIGHAARRAPAPCVSGYAAMQTRIAAIAELYDLISQSRRGQIVAVAAYLREIAKTMSASLLGEASGISIEATAEALDIDPERAVPLGLLVNELATNAIKHAFRDGIGRIVFSARRIGDQIELDVADNGAGMKDLEPEKVSGKHGADYVAIFVRQLGGTLTVLGTEGTGTTVRIQFPLVVVP